MTDMCLVQRLPGVTDLLAEASGSTGYLDVLHAPISLPTDLADPDALAYLTGPVDRKDAGALFGLCGLRISGSIWRVSRSIGARSYWPKALETLVLLASHGFSTTLLLADRRRIYLGEPDLGNFTLQMWMRAELGHHRPADHTPIPLSYMR